MLRYSEINIAHVGGTYNKKILINFFELICSKEIANYVFDFATKIKFIVKLDISPKVFMSNKICKFFPREFFSRW